MLVGLLPDAKTILRYLAKHDPAGYLSACMFAMVDTIDRTAGARGEAAMLFPWLALDQFATHNPMKVASESFLEEGHVNFATRADPRMSSPEKTWELFIASLKRGDLETAMACLTPGLQGKFRPSFARMPPDKLRSMADSFTKFSMTSNMGGVQEAVVVRGKQAGMIYFVNEAGAWKINEM